MILVEKTGGFAFFELKSGFSGVTGDAIGRQDDNATTQKTTDRAPTTSEGALLAAEGTEVFKPQILRIHTDSIGFVLC